MVSIIMPVYNAKEFISKAIDSILSQSYQDFELIIIDDGATDGTGEICAEYARNNTKIRYIKQKNGGCCKARNIGIELAQGEYITFSDHDDEYDPLYLEILVKSIEHNNSDMVKCGVHFIDIIGKQKKERYCKFNSKNVNQIQLSREVLFYPIGYFGVWNGLYRMKMIKDSGVRFDETMKYGQEDFMFNIELIPYLQNVSFVNECLYTHYKRENQSTSAQFHMERLGDVKKYLIKQIEVLSKFNKVLPKAWKNICFSQNYIGSIKYCKNAHKSYAETRTIVNQLFKDFEIEFSKRCFSFRYFKYILISWLSMCDNGVVFYIIYNLV